MLYCTVSSTLVFHSKCSTGFFHYSASVIVSLTNQVVIFSNFIRLNYIQIETYRLLQFLQIMFLLMRNPTNESFLILYCTLRPTVGRLQEFKVTEYNQLFTKLSITEMCQFWHTPLLTFATADVVSFSSCSGNVKLFVRCTCIER